VEINYNNDDYNDEDESISTKKRRVVGGGGEIKALTSKEVLIEPRESGSEVIEQNQHFYFTSDEISTYLNNGYQPENLQPYSLHIGQQPPSKVVYNRILKPFPAIMLKQNTFFGSQQSNNLFIDVYLIKNNDPHNVLPFLDGKGQKPISNNNYCIFDKLKITSTSKSNKCQFRLKFQLIQFDGLHYNPVPNVYVISNPVDVYSHSNYLKDDRRSRKKPSPPMVKDIIPSSGSSGDRCILLGANFINSKSLSIKIGELIIKPEFHEDVTLIFNIPQIPDSQSKVYQIQVSNDGEEYCGDKIFFTYIP